MECFWQLVSSFTFKNISVESPESFTLYLELRCLSLPASKECVEEIKLTSPINVTNVLLVSN